MRLDAARVAGDLDAMDAVAPRQQFHFAQQYPADAQPALLGRHHQRGDPGQFGAVGDRIQGVERDQGAGFAIDFGQQQVLAAVGDDVGDALGSLGRRFLGGYVTAQHCHAENKMRMLRTLGYDAIDIAYSDSTADLPLLRAARQPVVVNPKASRVEYFRKVLPATTPILNWGCKSRGGDPG